MGAVDGGRFTLVDGEMLVWFREVSPGDGRYSLEGRGPAPLVHEVSWVRRALLAQSRPRPEGDLGASRVMTFGMIRRYPLAAFFARVWPLVADLGAAVATRARRALRSDTPS